MDSIDSEVILKNKISASLLLTNVIAKSFSEPDKLSWNIKP